MNNFILQETRKNMKTFYNNSSKRLRSERDEAMLKCEQLLDAVGGGQTDETGDETTEERLAALLAEEENQ